MSAAQSTPSGHSPAHYLAIAVAIVVVSTLAVVAPANLIGLAVLVAPFVLVGLATDADSLDLVRDDPDPFGPELRVLPII